MSGKSWILQKPAVAGLFLRVGNRSWFWGRGTPSTLRVNRPARQAEPRAEAASDRTDSRWSGVADWLREMHALSARLAADSTPEKERQDDGKTT
jgi:hypothetical protein